MSQNDSLYETEKLNFFCAKQRRRENYFRRNHIQQLSRQFSKNGQY